MRYQRKAGALAGFASVLVLCGTAAAQGPAVDVRIEGRDATLLERTRVTLPGAPTPPPGSCPADSVAAAIEAGTQGNWDRASFVQTILGEPHTFTAMDYWAEWVDTGAGYRRGGGICTDRVKAGDEVLMLVDQPPYGEGSTTEVPLDLEGVPATTSPGTTVTVTVVGYVTTTPFGDIGDGVRRPVAGATVTGGGASATTGADGTATVRIDRTGVATLKANKAGLVPSAGERVSVQAGAPTTPGTSAGGTPGTKDTTAPRARISGLKTGARFAPARAPRTLSGSVDTEPSGVLAVKLRLTRRAGGRCAFYSGRKERFVPARCGRAFWFGIGDDASWSYLLPERLAPGRYVFEAKAIDRAFNRGDRAPARVVFRVT